MLHHPREIQRLHGLQIEYAGALINVGQVLAWSQVVRIGRVKILFLH